MTLEESGQNSLRQRGSPRPVGASRLRDGFRERKPSAPLKVTLPVGASTEQSRGDARASIVTEGISENVIPQAN